MKKSLFLILFLILSWSVFSQVHEKNNIVRNNPLSPAKVADALDAAMPYTATGTNTYAIAPGMSIYSGSNTYADGDVWKIIVTNANTSATTSLNVNSEGAIALKDAAGNNLAIGDLKAGGPYTFVYSSTGPVFRMLGGSGGAGGGGTVTSITADSPLTGGTITTSGNIGIQNAAADGSTKGAASFAAADFNASSGNISLDYVNGQEATSLQDGFLSLSDWTTFNNKANTSSGLNQFALTTSAQLAGVISDETGTGSLVFSSSPSLTTPNLGTPLSLILTNATGLPTAGIVNNAVTLGKIQQISEDRILGRISTGTGDVEQLTPGDVQDLVFNFSNDVLLFAHFTGSTTESGFSSVNNGTGSSVSVTSISDPGGKPGIATCNTGTTTTGYAYERTVPTSILLGFGILTIEGAFRVSTLSDGTETFTVVFGLHDNPGANAQDGAYFRYSSTLNSGQFQCVTANNSVETVTNLGAPYAVVAGTWYKVNLEINAAGTQVLFYIDDVLVATHTTNIPTGVGRVTGYAFGIAKSAGATNRTSDIDYVVLRYKLN